MSAGMRPLTATLYRPFSILTPSARGLVRERSQEHGMADAVLYSSADRVAVITLNRPEARNAVNPELAHALEDAIDELERDPEVWAGVLCANTADQSRPVFCAGADLKVIAATGDASQLATKRGGFAGFVYRERTKPVVVAVDGLATARGSRSCSPPTSSSPAPAPRSVSPR
jgi:enoyl-CoA hydratase